MFVQGVLFPWRGSSALGLGVAGFVRTASMLARPAHGPWPWRVARARVGRRVTPELGGCHQRPIRVRRPPVGSVLVESGPSESAAGTRPGLVGDVHVSA